MKPAHRIKLAGLMADKKTRLIFDIIQQDIKEPQILFVGGCVRDSLLGREVSDIDLATILPPEKIAALLRKSGIKVVPTGLDHGTVTAIIDGMAFQITTLRRDVATDGRRAVVAYTENWMEDARRRDFTLNSLLCDIRGNIFDPLGRGIDDLEKRKIVFVGEAGERIREDYLRILRFFRFQAWFGSGKMDADAVSACHKHRAGLKTISKERVTDEMLKLLRSPDPLRSLSVMKENRILPGLVAKSAPLIYFKQLKKIQNINFETLGFVILSGFSSAGTRRIAKELRLPNRTIKQLDTAIFFLKTFKEITPHSQKLLLYRAGVETAEIILISRMLIDGKNAAQITAALKEFYKIEMPVLPVTGRDLIAKGMKQGPEIKTALDKIERLWIRNGFTV